MTAAAWWKMALRDLEAAARAWNDLTPTDRKRVRQAVQRAQDFPDEALRDVGTRLAAVLADLEHASMIDSWSAGQELSPHTHFAIAVAFEREQQGLPPLADDEPIPGCACASCTEHSARNLAGKRKLQETRQAVRDQRRGGRDRRAEWERQVERARGVPITEIAYQLGLGTPEGTGKEVRVLCPFHDDTNPSLSLNTKDDVWYCHVCGEGGDSLELYMRVRGVGFADAVRELTNT